MIRKAPEFGLGTDLILQEETDQRRRRRRWLQFRILHNILTTNRSVAKFKPEQTPLCQFCKSHSETIHHLLWACIKVKTFWNELSCTMNSRCTHAHNFKIDEKLAIFGQSIQIKTDYICEFILLMAKCYI